ncbi:MAG: Gldg family protein [Deltaproteobacteria bacterium]|nr:Gldg family protein [Deltaproteobacteria bacterium]
MYWVFRRELAATLRAPILFLVGGVFLVVQGIAFAGLVNALSDVRRAAPLGALLEGQLAGTLLTWVMGLVVLTLLGMRTVAEDKRSGAWELLLTAQVGEGVAVVGKWLAAVAVYAILWLPTLAYLGVVAVFRTDSGGWDLGAIVCGYGGAIAIGAALLAWSVAASAAASSTLGAGGLGFGWAIGLFLAGELPALWPELPVEHPTVAAALHAVSIREAALAFARGEVGTPQVALVVGLAVTGLSLAMAFACAGRRRRAEVRLRFGGTVAIAAIATLVGVIAVEHPMRIDVSFDGRNTLDDQTREVLEALPGRALVTIVRPTLAGLEPIYDEATRVAERMAEVAPGMRVHTVDPADAPGGLAAVARAAGLQQTDLASSGAVVVDLDGKRRVVDLFELASFAARTDVTQPATVAAVTIERSLAGALAGLASARPVVACATTGHGELPTATRTASGADWSAVTERLRAEGITVEDLALPQPIPPRCDVVLVAGPAQRFSPAEALALQAHVRAGRGLLVAAPSRAVQGAGDGTFTAIAPTGLEPVLATDGLGLPPAVVVDPTLGIRELPGALFVVSGYVEHPINAGFAGARGTIWYVPHAVTAAGGATPLVVASPASWGETDLVTSPPTKSGDDLAGPVALAALGSTRRVIAVGSAETFATATLTGGASAADLWLARAVRYLAGATGTGVDVAARKPHQVRLLLTPSQRTAIVAFCVGGIPLLWAVGGALLLYLRRRRS